MVYRIEHRDADLRAGDLDQAHQPNEYVRRELFERGPAMLQKVIDKMCG